MIFAVLLGIETLHNYAIHASVQGFTTVILLILITSSVVMFALGVIGLYISRIYDEAKKRPRYILYKHEKGKKIFNWENFKNISETHQVISSKLSTGKVQIRVLSDSEPITGFTEVQPEIEDLYFATINDLDTESNK